MSTERKLELIEHALNELWKLHMNLEEGSRTDKRLETVIRKLYDLQDVVREEE